MILRWHGHVCYEFRSDFTIVVDPHDGRSIGLSPPMVTADLTLVTHDHYDHNQVRKVQGLRSRTIREAGRYQFKSHTIRAITAFHDDVKGAKRGEIVMFKFELEGLKFLFTGDLGHLPDAQMVSRLGEVDLLFIPVGGVFTLDAVQAWEATHAIAPRVVVPMHYHYGGLTLAINSVQPFIEQSPWPVETLGNEMTLEREDLPEQPEVWRFLQ